LDFLLTKRKTLEKSFVSWILKYLHISSFIKEYFVDSKILDGVIKSLSERQKEKSFKIPCN